MSDECHKGFIKIGLYLPLLLIMTIDKTIKLFKAKITNPACLACLHAYFHLGNELKVQNDVLAC